jgi:hypothetical protein
METTEIDETVYVRWDNLWRALEGEGRILCAVCGGTHFAMEDTDDRIKVTCAQCGAESDW